MMTGRILNGKLLDLSWNTLRKMALGSGTQGGSCTLTNNKVTDKIVDAAKPYVIRGEEK